MFGQLVKMVLHDDEQGAVMFTLSTHYIRRVLRCAQLPVDRQLCQLLKGIPCNSWQQRKSTGGAQPNIVQHAP